MHEATTRSGTRFMSLVWFLLALLVGYGNFVLKSRQLGVTSMDSENLAEAMTYGLCSFLFGSVCLFWRKYRSIKWYFIFCAALGGLVMFSAISRV